MSIKEECLICNEILEYLEQDELMECAICPVPSDDLDSPR